MNSNPSRLLSTARILLKQLPSELKKGFITISALMTLTATLETLTLGTVAVLVSALTDAETVLRSEHLTLVRRILGSAQFWQTPRGLVVSLCIVLVILVLVKNSLLAANSYFSTLLSARVETHYGTRLLRGMLCKNYPWHLKHNSADLIQTVTWRYFLGRGYFIPLLQFVSDSILITLMLAALLLIQPLPTLAVLLILTTLGTLLYKQIRRSLDKIARQCTHHELSINKFTAMALQGIKDVKIYGKEHAFLDIFTTEASVLSTSLGMRNFYSGLSVWVLEALGLSLMAGGILVLMLSGGVSTAKITGMLSLFAVSAWRALPAANRIIGSLTSMRGIMSYIDHTFSFLNQFSKMSALPATPSHGPPLFRDLNLSDITFAYTSSDSDSLHGINLHLQAGQMLGIIGHSGAGKSTLADILIGLLEPSGGTIKVNGELLEAAEFSKWSKCIGYVPQSPYICDDTLAANVAFGVKPDAIDRDRVLQCCQLAAMDFLADLPHGVDTLIGERGGRLSGGQRQRIAIARALYSQPQLLLLDEATSSLDRKNEDSILRTIYSLRGSMTMVIVAHRLSTVERCDTIMWLEKGRIRMVGTPKEVLPEYARLVRSEEGSSGSENALHT